MIEKEKALIQDGAYETPPAEGQDSLLRAVAAGRRHLIGAFNGSQAACECDRRWRSREDYADHVARIVAFASGDEQGRTSRSAASGRTAAALDDCPRCGGVMGADTCEDCLWPNSDSKADASDAPDESQR